MSQDMWEDVVLSEEDSSVQGVKEVAADRPANIGAPEILRIEEQLYCSWGGVDNCHVQSRIDREVAGDFRRWVERKMYEFRHLRWLGYGHGGGRVRVRRTRAPWPDNSRSCRGWVTLDCYIEFRKP